MMVHSDTPKNLEQQTSERQTLEQQDQKRQTSEATNLRSDKPRKRQMCRKPLTSEKSKKNLRRDTKLTYLVYYLFQQDQDSEATNDKTYSNKAEIQEWPSLTSPPHNKNNPIHKLSGCMRSIT